MTLRAKLPSTGALFMFEAAARHLNFTLAAREFNVTQPAISRTIARLETHLGRELFSRRATGLELTEAGELLLRGVRAGFDQIESALDELATLRQEDDTVTISVTSAFAIHWLMPRFDRVRQDIPGVTLRLDLIHGEPYGTLGAADIGIRYDAAPTPETEAIPLVEEVVIPVCSPAYREAHGKIDGANGMRGQFIACLTGKMRLPWQTVLPLISDGQLRDATELLFSDYALVLQGAIKGQAIALGWWHVVAHEMLANGLVPAGDRMLKTGAWYSLTTRRSSSSRPAVQKLQAWLIREFAALESERDKFELKEVALRTDFER